MSFELPQQMAFEPGVRLEKLCSQLLVSGLPPPASHPRSDQREVLDRPDECTPLEQLSLLPQQAVELGDIVRPEPTPEHQLLRRRHARDRIDLEEAELANGLELAPRAAVEQLCPNGDAPGLGG